MNKNQENFLRQNINGVDYIKKYANITEAGNIYKGLCIFHNEKTPSMVVYPKGFIGADHKPQDHDTFYCFGCHAGGDIIKFKQLVDGSTREEAFLKLAEEHDITFGEDEELLSQKMALENINELNKLNSLSDINIICSESGFACKQFFRDTPYSKEVNKKVDELFEKLDNLLKENSAETGQFIIDWFGNELSIVYKIFKK